MRLIAMLATLASFASAAESRGADRGPTLLSVPIEHVRVDDAFLNRLTFDPIETTAIRIEAQLQAGWSGGILEWLVEGPAATPAAPANLPAARPAPEVSIRVDAGAPGRPVSRHLTGACIEDVNHEIYGGSTA